MIDLETLKGAIQTLAAAVTALRAAMDLMPSSPEREAAGKAIDNAERAVQIAEAQAAREFGYPLCGSTWPPQIMLLQPATRAFRCSACERIEDRTPKPQPQHPRSDWLDAR